MDEPEVVRRVHRHLIHHGVGGEPLARLFTDPHPTLTGFTDLRPFQRFAIGEQDFVVHPDLLGQQRDSESLIAVEAKGERDLLKGLAQAEAYQDGVQRSFLAAPASALGENFVLRARERGVGILAVSDRVEVLHVPQSRRPLNTLYKGLISEIGSAAWVTEGGTFLYNLPTHYLVWTAILRANSRYDMVDLPDLFKGYPMPADWRAALRGARKLGLITQDGQSIMLTDVGGTVRCLMPTELEEWASIHRDLAQPRSSQVLIDRCPPAGLILRLMLLRDPIVRLVVDGLRRLPSFGGSFLQLAESCSFLDRRSAVIFFLNPEATPLWASNDGRVAWAVVPAACFRSSTFFQYKSVLKHAGLIMPNKLGSATAKSYRPDQDVWQLRLLDHNDLIGAAGPA